MSHPSIIEMDNLLNKRPVLKDELNVFLRQDPITNYIN